MESMMPTDHGLSPAPRKPRSDKGLKRGPRGPYKPRGTKPKDLARKVKKALKTKATGQRADGLPKQPQMARKGGRKYGYTQDGRKLSAGWVVDNQPPTPDKEESRYPEDHPLWPAFKIWVSEGTVVRRDLLDFHTLSKSGNDWKQVWLTFVAGALGGASTMIGT